MMLLKTRLHCLTAGSSLGAGFGCMSVYREVLTTYNGDERPTLKIARVGSYLNLKEFEYNSNSSAIDGSASLLCLRVSLRR